MMRWTAFCNQSMNPMRVQTRHASRAVGLQASAFFVSWRFISKFVKGLPRAG